MANNDSTLAKYLDLCSSTSAVPSQSLIEFFQFDQQRQQQQQRGGQYVESGKEEESGGSSSLVLTDQSDVDIEALSLVLTSIGAASSPANTTSGGPSFTSTGPNGSASSFS